MTYRHLDTHLLISAEQYPDFAQDLGGDPSSVALAAGWELDIVGESKPSVTYITTPSPIGEINKTFMLILAKYARRNDWIALQSGTSIPVLCHLIQFDGAGGYAETDTTWGAWCARDRSGEQL